MYPAYCIRETDKDARIQGFDMQLDITGNQRLGRFTQ